MMNRFDRHQPLAANAACPFCTRESFEHILAESDQLYLAADNAPLVEGHMLIVPKVHYTCFGATPTDLDREAMPLLSQALSFCEAMYRPAIVFEHGIFAQSVPHAHLHVVPLGTGIVKAQSDGVGAAARGLADVRENHAGSRHYLYLAHANGQGELEGYLYPPDVQTYSLVLGSIQGRSVMLNPTFAPQHIRREGGAAQMAALAERWAQWQARNR